VCATKGNTPGLSQLKTTQTHGHNCLLLPPDSSAKRLGGLPSRAAAAQGPRGPRACRGNRRQCDSQPKCSIECAPRSVVRAAPRLPRQHGTPTLTLSAVHAVAQSQRCHARLAKLPAMTRHGAGNAASRGTAQNVPRGLSFSCAAAACAGPSAHALWCPRLTSPGATAPAMAQRRSAGGQSLYAPHARTRCPPSRPGLLQGHRGSSGPWRTHTHTHSHAAARRHHSQSACNHVRAARQVVRSGGVVGCIRTVCVLGWVGVEPVAACKMTHA
jgi:hypothetical protein